MKPLLAHVYESYRVSYPCYIQPKLNGIRALYQNGRFQSRDEQPFGEALLRHLAEPLLATFDPSVILDGELYVHGWPLQRINGAVTPVRNEPNEDTVKVQYHVFDVVDYTKSFIDRFEFAANKICSNYTQGVIHHVTTWQVENETDANSNYAALVNDKFEGIMYRLGDCPYTLPKQINEAGWNVNSRARALSDKSNRCWHLLKRKSWQDDEFICIGVEEGEGKYVDAVGAIRCACDSLSFTVSGGLTDSQRAKYFDHPELIIGKQIKVRYLCLSEAGLPLNPTIEAIL